VHDTFSFPEAKAGRLGDAESGYGVALQTDADKTAQVETVKGDSNVKSDVNVFEDVSRRGWANATMTVARVKRFESSHKCRCKLK
jgi:uncharacterized protein YdbL (DUF1318 family)